jgi:phosphoribosyl 1,2-cyclic phosphodiesterase/CheY-like chemotaxis protein
MKTVILIDEDLASREAMAGWLTDAGWRVVVAEDGEVGLDLIQRHPPELVVCDLLMPRCNGFQLCRTVRKDPQLKDKTKLIVTTASGYMTDRLNATDAGANECVVKPIQRLEFLRLVQALTTGETTLLTRKSTQDNIRFDRPPNVPALPLDDPVRLRFWGVRGSIPTPGPATVRYGGNTSCLEVRADGEIIILDAGTGIAPLGAHLAQEFKGRSFDISILISHTHWDHIQGFPFFEPAYNPANGVRIIGFKGAREGLASTLSSQMESPFFPIRMQQIPANISVEEMRDLKFKIGAVSVEATYLNHPGLCMGYRINTSCGSIAYLPDNEPYQRFKYHTASPETANSVESLEYARRQDQRIVDFIQGADILVIDSQYDATEYQTRIGWGHGCVDDVVALALSAKVKRLFLFHHDPRHNDDFIDKMAEWGSNFVTMLGDTLPVECAREGLEIILPRPQP